MKNLKELIFILAFAFAFFAGCSEDTIDSVKFGTIDGTVVDDETDEPISGVEITTSPASSTAFTNELGQFVLNSVPTDDYSVQAEFDGYVSSFEPATVLDGVTSTISFKLIASQANNRPPTAPELASPEDGSLDVPLTVDLIWSSSDPDGDEVNYTINFRNSSTNEVEVYEVEQDTMFTVENLQIATSYFWQVTADDDINAPVSSEISEFSTLVIPDNPFLFVKEVQGNNVIFSGNQQGDGTGQTDPNFNLVRLTDESSNSYRPRKSPIANRIAFLRNEGSDVHLFTMNLDGTDVDQITTSVPVVGFRNDEVDFTWALNGSKLYYPSLNKIWSINSDGSGRTLIYSTTDGSVVSEVAVPKFDEDLLLIKTNNLNGYQVRVFTYRISTGTEEIVVFENTLGAVDGVDIDANAQTVLYSWDTSESQNSSYIKFDSRLFEFDLDTQTMAQVQTDVDLGQNDLDPRYSPDEGSIIFVRAPSGSNNSSVFRRLLGQGVDDTELFQPGIMPDWE